jgi:hypothetical protein
MRPLPSRGQSAPMTKAPVRTDFHESLDVQGNGFAQVPFDHAIPLDNVPDAHRFIFGQVFYLCVDVDGRFRKDLGCPAFAKAVKPI